jgi:hypothetical protein
MCTSKGEKGMHLDLMTKMKRQYKKRRTVKDPMTAEDEDAQICSNSEAVEEDGTSEADKTASGTKGYNINCCLNVWSKGADLLVTDRVKEKRLVQKRQFDREKKC